MAAAVDGLTALRAAIIGGRAGAITYDAAAVTLTIDGVAYAALAETAFKCMTSARKRYKLLSIWLQYQMRDGTYPMYMALTKEHKANISDMVLAPEKKTVIDYLIGASTAPDNIDKDMLMSGALASDSAEPASTVCAARARTRGCSLGLGDDCAIAASWLLYIRRSMRDRRARNASLRAARRCFFTSLCRHSLPRAAAARLNDERAAL